MLEQPLDFTGYLSIHIFIFLPFPDTVSDATLGTLKKLILKEIHSQNCSHKKYIFKIAPSKITFSKLLFLKTLTSYL